MKINPGLNSSIGQIINLNKMVSDLIKFPFNFLLNFCFNQLQRIILFSIRKINPQRKNLVLIGLLLNFDYIKRNLNRTIIIFYFDVLIKPLFGSWTQFQSVTCRKVQFRRWKRKLRTLLSIHLLNPQRLNNRNCSFVSRNTLKNNRIYH